jgi:hypothetical protein
MGQRNIPFRGHNWDKITKREDGNFDFLVHWKAKARYILTEGYTRGTESGICRAGIP